MPDTLAQSKRLKILLIGNYANSRQPSMQRFAQMMRDGLASAGHDARLITPPAVLGRLAPGETGAGKWLGYIDRFVGFPAMLRKQARWADIVHICDQANAVYIPYLGDTPHLVTCHDVFAIRAYLGEIAESRLGPTGRLFQAWILRNLRKSRAVACVSEQTRDELCRITALTEENTIVVPNALNDDYRPMDIEEASTHLQKLAIDARLPYCLHVGGNQWYKNRPGVVRIFSELRQRPGYAQHRLLMAGKPWSADLRALVQDLGLTGRVRELVNVSNEELRALYSRADVFLFASLQEGFGWPIVEAQACGCPVVTTNRRPMTDVGGNAAIYVDPAQPAAAAATIAEALGDDTRRRRAGIENAKRYSREAMIAGYIACYQRACRSGVSC